MLAADAMNSMAQQAVPNGIGQSEFARAQLTRKSRRVVTQPSWDVRLDDDAGRIRARGQSHCSAPFFQT